MDNNNDCCELFIGIISIIVIFFLGLYQSASIHISFALIWILVWIGFCIFACVASSRQSLQTQQNTQQIIETPSISIQVQSV